MATEPGAASMQAEFYDLTGSDGSPRAGPSEGSAGPSSDGSERRQSIGGIAMDMQALGMASPLKRPRDEEEDDEELVYVGEKTRAERDAELLRDAVDITDDGADTSTPPALPIKSEEASSTPPPPVAVKIERASPAPKQPQRAVSVALSGRNLFLTGGAGVGKSHTLRAIIDALVAKHGERYVAVTASTGCASVHIDGQTLHSLGGVGVPVHISDFGRLFGKKGNADGVSKSQAWKEMKALIVDEVSMADAEYLDVLSLFVDRVVNYSDVQTAFDAGLVRQGLPFGGGVQLIFVGDFMQLLPVRKQPQKQQPQPGASGGGASSSGGSGLGLSGGSMHQERLRGDKLQSLSEAPPGWPKLMRTSNNGKSSAVAPAYGAVETRGHSAFKSVLWREAAFVTIELTTVHRTRAPVLLDALNDIRLGLGSSASVGKLVEVTRRPLPPRAPVTAKAALKAAEEEKGKEDEAEAAKEEPVRLFCTNRQCDALNEERLQLLLRAAALKKTYTAKDSVEVDGETLEEEETRTDRPPDRDALEVDLEEELWASHFREHSRPHERDDPQFDERTTFAVGAQVMLTRNEQPGGFVNGDLGCVVRFRLPTPEEVEALEEAGEIMPGEASVEYPVVRFHRESRNGDSEKLVTPANQSRRLYRVGKCLRRRLPLQLAWAITVHKSQGMSLPLLQVELDNAFAEGQVYVALSRATTIEGLCIRSFDRSRVKVSYDAKRFHDAARAASAARDERLMASFLADNPCWWKDVVEGPRTHPGWAAVCSCYGAEHGTSYASEFRRWVHTYPVPQRLRRLGGGGDGGGAGSSFFFGLSPAERAKAALVDSDGPRGESLLETAHKALPPPYGAAAVKKSDE